MIIIIGGRKEILEKEQINKIILPEGHMQMLILFCNSAQSNLRLLI